MKAWGVKSFVVTMVAVAGVAFAVGVIVPGALDDDGPQTVEPTEYSRRMTGSEAAEKAKRSPLHREGFVDILLNPTPTEEERNLLLSATCLATDFNESDRAWIVVCQYLDVRAVTFRVFDATGKVEVVK